MTQQTAEETIETARQWLKADLIIWQDPEVPGYVPSSIRAFSDVKTVLHDATVIEHDGHQLVCDAEGQLVPKLGQIPDGSPIVYDDEKGMRLIAKAEDDDQVAHKALMGIASRFVASGCAMPVRLRKYVADALRKQSRTAPERRRGPDPYANHLRDSHLGRVIGRLVKLGFRPTRNRATETESACSIVAKALERLGIHLSEGAVEKVWERLSPGFRERVSSARD